MLRFVRMALGLILILAMTGREARAQWGFDGWGWMGWGAATPESAALHGAGEFAMGAGLYNLNTAQAESINADTAMKFNDYVAQVTREAARIHEARRDQRLAKNRSLYDARQRQLRENPSRRDIELGDALNAAVVDLSDPRLGSAALRAAKVPVPASLIAEVPFIVASERVTLMLENIRSSIAWSDVFEGERFANDKKTFDDLVERMRTESYEGDLSPKIMREARGFVKDLTAKLAAQPLSDPGDQKEALRFVHACSGLLDLLESPKVGPALLQLRKIQDTMIGNLLGFMHTYNLRFGPAKEPNQRQAYARLFEILDQTRDQILDAVKLDSKQPPETNPKNATDFLESVDQTRSKAGALAPP